MYRAMADPNKPRLRVRAAGKQAIRRRQEVFGHFERAGFDIDSDNLALVAFFYLWTNLSLVDFSAAPGKLLFTVAWL
jgi:hypothetical protein